MFYAETRKISIIFGRKKKPFIWSYIVSAALHTFAFTLAKVFVCAEVLQPSQPIGVMLSVVNLPNLTFTGVLLTTCPLVWDQ